MILPIKLTSLRILLSPLFAIFIFIPDRLLSSSLCLMLVIIAIYSDIMDGYIARSRNQVTITGKLLDPIADVTFYITAFVVLFFQDWIPLNVILILTMREIGVNIIIRPLISYLNLNPQARVFGKLKTVFQSILLILILIIRVAVLYLKIPRIGITITAMSYLLAVFSVLSAFPYIMILNPNINIKTVVPKAEDIKKGTVK